MSSTKTAPPSNSAAQEKTELEPEQLLRSMAQKMVAAAEEEERERRIREEISDTHLKDDVYNQLTVVQEDLVRSINLLRVSDQLEVLR